MKHVLTDSYIVVIGRRLQTSGEAVVGGEASARRLWSADERHRQPAAGSTHDRRRQSTTAVDADTRQRRRNVVVIDVQNVDLRAPACDVTQSTDYYWLFVTFVQNASLFCKL